MSVKRGVYRNDDNVLLALAEIELLSRLKTDVQVAVDTEVSIELENAIRDLVYSNVYDTYINRDYIRRGDKGGLSDTRKYETVVYPLDDTETVVTTSVNVNGSKQDKNIVPIVESGRGYNWKNSEIYKSKQPRPFLQEAAELIVKDHSALAAVADFLQKIGWEVNSPYKRLHTPKKEYGDPNAINDALAKEAFGRPQRSEWAEDGEVF